MPSCDRNRSKVLVVRYLVKISEVLSYEDTRERDSSPLSTKSWMNSSLMEMCLVSLLTPRREARAVADVESVAKWCEALSSGGQICRFRGSAEIYDHAQFFESQAGKSHSIAKAWVECIPNF